MTLTIAPSTTRRTRARAASVRTAATATSGASGGPGGGAPAPAAAPGPDPAAPTANPRPTLGVLVEYRADRSVLLVLHRSPRGLGPITAPDQPAADAVALARAAVAEQTYLRADGFTEIPTGDPHRRLVLAYTDNRIEPAHRLLTAAFHSRTTLQQLADAASAPSPVAAANLGLLPEWIPALREARLIDHTE